MRYIDADLLNKRMYHEAFEIDSDMQKWDSGCWIRYKVFENCLEQMPTADVKEVVRCKDCKYFMNHIRVKGTCDVFTQGDYDYKVYEDDYCSRGERREDGEIH